MGWRRLKGGRGTTGDCSSLSEDPCWQPEAQGGCGGGEKRTDSNDVWVVDFLFLVGRNRVQRQREASRPSLEEGLGGLAPTEKGTLQ